MNIYYAHPLNLYNTKQEERDMDSLRMIFEGSTIVNPNNPETDALYKTTWSMQVFFDIIKECDLLVFRAIPSGQITAGVAAEINVAIEYGIPVLELPSMIFSRIMSPQETRQYLHEIGQR